MKVFSKINYMLCLIIAINVLLVTFYFNQKQDFHIDEIYTFAHANSRQGAFLAVGTNSFLKDTNHQIFGHTHSKDFFHDYVTVQPGDEFEYTHIIDNLSAGVHPPLYYFLLHTVSSLTPGVMSKWQAYPINILILVLFLLVFYLCAKKIFTDQKLVYLAVVFCGFSLVTLDMAVYIRSYVLQMFLSTCLLYEHIKLLENPKMQPKNLSAIFILAFLSYLTHFYMIISVFFLSAVTCFLLLRQKKYTALCSYAALMLGSIALFFVIYYPALDVLMNSHRGKETTKYVSAIQDVAYLDNSVRRFFEVILTTVFPFSHANLAYCVVVLILAGSFMVMCRDKISDQNQNTLLLTFGIFYGIAISLIHPEMYGYNDRYYVPAISALCLLIVWFADRLLMCLSIKAKFRFCILSVLVVVNVFLTDFCHRSLYIFRRTPTMENVFALTKQQDIMYAGYFWVLIQLVPVFQKTDTVKIVELDDLSESLLNSTEKYLIVSRDNPRLKPRVMEPVKLDIATVGKLTYLWTFNYGPHWFDFYAINAKI